MPINQRRSPSKFPHAAYSDARIRRKEWPLRAIITKAREKGGFFAPDSVVSPQLSG
jgi:hypothetical protein